MIIELTRILEGKKRFKLFYTYKYKKVSKNHPLIKQINKYGSMIDKFITFCFDLIYLLFFYNILSFKI
jgi:hypothetical protein